MKILKLTAFVLSVVFMLFLVSCKGDEGIVGLWETSGDLNGEEITLSYEFREDKTGCHSIEGFSADSFTYEIYENRGELLITEGSITETVKYSLDKDTLTLDIDGQNIIFYRAK